LDVTAQPKLADSLLGPHTEIYEAKLNNGFPFIFHCDNELERDESYEDGGR
jgi:hypothetical protein